MDTKLKLGWACALSLAGICAAGAGAATTTYKIDNVHTCALFKINHLDVAWFYGRFNAVSGSFTVDDEDPSKFNITVEIKAASIDTNSKERDQHLRSPQYFNVERHPVISFRSTSVAAKGDDAYAVTGELTLLGVTKKLTVDLQWTGEGRDPFGGYRKGFHTVFKVKRSDFGMTEMLGPLSDEVEFTLSSEGVKQ